MWHCRTSNPTRKPKAAQIAPALAIADIARTSVLATAPLLALGPLFRVAHFSVEKMRLRVSTRAAPQFCCSRFCCLPSIYVGRLWFNRPPAAHRGVMGHSCFGLLSNAHWGTFNLRAFCLWAEVSSWAGPDILAKISCVMCSLNCFFRYWAAHVNLGHTMGYGFSVLGRKHISTTFQVWVFYDYDSLMITLWNLSCNLCIMTYDLFCCI
jgi:hypothetical protein